MGWRLVFVLIVCFAALFIFRDNPKLAPLRAVTVDATASVYRLATAPINLWGNLADFMRSRELLREDNARLRQENLAIKGQAQRLAAVVAENARYRALLNSADVVQGDVMMAEIISVSADPARHLLVLNKGLDDGVTRGQPLLGADGLMGQVVLLGNDTSRAMLITDSTHAVPIQVNRNGVRGLAEGTGDPDHLIVRHVAATTDIVVGDILVTSGLGGRFPPGYPVAEVQSIDIAPGAAFATVTARPLAKLDRGRYVMLVVNSSQGQP